MFKGGPLKINKDVLAALSGNRWVLKITDSQIIYTYKFKVEAVEQYLRGITAEEIFVNAGIPLKLLGKDYARHCIKRWTKKSREQGLDTLKDDKRGTAKGPLKGRPRVDKDKLTYAELEAIIKIQTEVIETLKKRRALAQKK